MKDPRSDSKNPIEGHNKEGECTINDTIPGIIKYGVKPSELGGETIRTGEELEKNITTKKGSPKNIPHKSSKKEVI